MHNMETDTCKERKSKKGDVTLYNFGYAPKEVIEKFQQFCCQFSSLSEAIYSLLKREKSLKYKYRFIVSPVTHQMLARPTKNDKPNAIRCAMIELYKCMKQSHYTSVSDVIEELLCSLTENDQSFSDYANNNEKNFSICKYPSLNEVEQEALSKIADAVIYKLESLQYTKKRRHPQDPEVCAKTIKKNTPSKKKQFSPKEKTSPSKNKTKSKKVIDPEYLPVNQKCLWTKFGGEASKASLPTLSMSAITCLSAKSERSEPSDIELLMPVRRLSNIAAQPYKTKSFIKNSATSATIACEKSNFLLQYLDLLPSSKNNNQAL